MRNDRARHTGLVLTLGQALPSPHFCSCAYFSIMFFGVGNLLARMLFVTVYVTRRISIGYRRILSTMAADILKEYMRLPETLCKSWGCWALMFIYMGCGQGQIY